MGARSASHAHHFDPAIGRCERHVQLQHYRGMGARILLPPSTYLPPHVVATPNHHTPSPDLHIRRGRGERHGKDSAQHPCAARKRCPPHTTSCRTCALLFHNYLRVGTLAGPATMCVPALRVQKEFLEPNPPLQRATGIMAGVSTVSWQTRAGRRDSKTAGIDFKPRGRAKNEKKKKTRRERTKISEKNQKNKCKSEQTTTACHAAPCFRASSPTTPLTCGWWCAILYGKEPTR